MLATHTAVAPLKPGLRPTSPPVADVSCRSPLQVRLGPLPLRNFAAKEHVYCEGDPKAYVFQVERGVVMIYRMLPDGRRQVVDFAYPGDFIGLGSVSTHVFSAETTGPATLRCIQANMLEDAARHNPEIALALYRSVSLELMSARTLLVAIGQRSALERVATFILNLCRRLPENAVQDNEAVIELPMRRADIADLLGLTIETVSRTITKLRMLRLIEVNHGTQIRIRNLVGLENIAEVVGDI